MARCRRRARTRGAGAPHAGGRSTARAVAPGSHRGGRARPRRLDEARFAMAPRAARVVLADEPFRSSDRRRRPRERPARVAARAFAGGRRAGARLRARRRGRIGAEPSARALRLDRGARGRNDSDADTALGAAAPGARLARPAARELEGSGDGQPARTLARGTRQRPSPRIRADRVRDGRRRGTREPAHGALRRRDRQRRDDARDRFAAAPRSALRLLRSSRLGRGGRTADVVRPRCDRPRTRPRRRALGPDRLPLSDRGLSRGAR